MKIAMLSTITRQESPRHRDPRENMVSLLTEGLLSRGMHVTLFAAGDSQIRGKTGSPYQQDNHPQKAFTPTIWECLHISEVFEQSNSFDLIHNHFDYLPLTYSAMTTTPLVTTMYGKISSNSLPVYQKYNDKTFYVATSEADKSTELDYISLIYQGIDLNKFTFQANHGDYLVCCGHIHPGSGTNECIEVARRTGIKLIISGTIYDQEHFDRKIAPFLDNHQIILIDNFDSQKQNELLSNAYALIHHDQFDGDTGLSQLEAMACGTPVIGINHGGMPEIVSDGITGFLVSGTDEMIGAISRIKQLDRLQCRRWIENRFSADRMVDDYIKVYEKVAEKTKREDHRPWGFYEILLDAPEHKVKRITVYPGQRLSYQRHFRRSEHWYIIGGTAILTRNGKDIELTFGQSVDLPVGTWHRVRNPGSENMVFIEVQTGDYFGEDDIERSEDDYGRT